MPNANGTKGKAFERDIMRFLSEAFGRQVRRPHQEGFLDVGDIHLSPWALQAKNYANTTDALNVGVRDAEIQAERAEEAYGAAVIKKRGSNIAEARVAMTLRTFRRVTARLLQAEALLQRYAPEQYHQHVQSLKEKP